MIAPPPETTASAPTGRRRLFAGFAFDLVTLVGAALTTGLVAIAWLLTRTEAGLVDPSDGDAVVAFAMWAAALPAWSAWQWRSLALHATSRGMQSVAPGAASQLFSGRRRVMWYLLHPVTVPAWIWLALTAAIPGPFQLAVLPAAIATLQTVMTVTSCIVVFIKPSRPPGHVRIARGRRRRRT